MMKVMYAVLNITNDEGTLCSINAKFESILYLSVQSIKLLASHMQLERGAARRSDAYSMISSDRWQSLPATAPEKLTGSIDLH